MNYNHTNGDGDIPLKDRLQKGISEGLLCIAMSIGLRTGLIKVLLGHREPISMEQLAEEAGCKPRYVDEWLGVMTSAGVTDMDSTTQTYTLKEQYRRELGDEPSKHPYLVLSTFFQCTMAASPLVQDAFTQHGPLGTSYADYNNFSELMDLFRQSCTSTESIRKMVDLAPGLRVKLESGVQVCEFGAGKGYQARLMAQIYPKSTFLVTDISEEAIHKGQKIAEKQKLTNLKWKVLDASDVPSSMDDKFEVVFVCEALHDIPQASLALRCCKRVLKKDGHLIITEPEMESGHSRNSGSYSTMVYGFSMLHSLPVSLAVPGSQGLGSAWGKDKMRLFCTEAGLRVIHCKSIGDGNVMLICSK